MTETRQTPGAGAASGGSSKVSVVATNTSIRPAGDVLLPVASGIFCQPHRGRGHLLVLALDCPHCRGDHRHVTREVRPGGLTRNCPVTGRPYVVLPASRRKAVRR